MLKVLFVLKILTYLSWLFGYVKKRLDQNTNINFKIYDVTECIKKNNSTRIAQYPRKSKTINERNLVSEQNIMWDMSFSKNHAEYDTKALVTDLFCFFTKALYKVKASARHLNFNIFWETSTWTYNENKLYNIFYIFYPEISSILIFHKRVWD